MTENSSLSAKNDREDSIVTSMPVYKRVPTSLEGKNTENFFILGWAGLNLG
jgi:hypothetical protein